MKLTFRFVQRRVDELIFMASDWGQNWNLDFVASKGPTHVENSSSGHRFRFFVASLSCCDALCPYRRSLLFVSSYCFVGVGMLPVLSYCVLRVVELLVSSYCFLRVVVLSSIRRRLHKLVSGTSTNGSG